MSDERRALPTIGSGPKINFDQLSKFQSAKSIERQIQGDENFTKLLLWLHLAWDRTKHPGLKLLLDKLPEMRAGHGGFDRNKDIELVQAHSDITYKVAAPGLTDQE